MSPTPPDAVPHRFPFRLVERAEPRDCRVLAVVLATATGALTGPGPWPVTLVAEALAQAILLVTPHAGVAPLRLIGLEGVRLLQPVQAGDRLEVEVEEAGSFGAMRRYSCRARRAGALAAVAEITVSG